MHEIVSFSDIFPEKSISERLRGRKMPKINFWKAQMFFENSRKNFQNFYSGRLSAILTEGSQCQKLPLRGAKNAPDRLTGQKSFFFESLRYCYPNPTTEKETSN